MKAFLITILFLSVISCKKDTETTQKTINKTNTETENIKPDLIKNYWHLEGKIRDKNIAMELTKTATLTETGDENTQEYFSAYYYDLDQEHPINLNQTDTEFTNNILNLSGFIDGKDEILSGTFDGKTYKGEWSSNGNTETFELIETYKNGATPFKFHSINEKITAEKNQANYQIQLAYSEKNDLINDTIKAALFGKATKGTIEELIKANFEDYKKSYLRDLKNLKKEDPENTSSNFFNFSNVKSIFPIVNSNNRLILEYYFYDFTGGAHGMHGSYFYNYDKKKNKFLGFKDIFNTDKKTIGKIITNEIRKKYKAEPNQKLDDIQTEGASFIVEEAEFTENFKLTKKGIIFYYNVYDLTPYAMGPYEVFVSYDVLKPYLKTDFEH